MYIHHAKNIVEGVDYQATGYIYNPSRPITPKTYPPILLLLLSPIYKWYGLNLGLMKIEVTLFFLASLYMLFLIFKNELLYHYILAILVLIGFNPFFGDYKDNISVDLPFIFFTYSSVYLAQRQYEVHLSDANRSISSILIGLSIYLSYGTRSVGILLNPMLNHLRPNKKSPDYHTIYLSNRCIFDIFLHPKFIFTQ
jgi:hypothetical protein